MAIGDDNGSLTVAHIGDLHITGEMEPNYRDFLSLIESINADFCLLPGDNADDGSAEQYALIRSGLKQLKIPVHMIAGDHDRKPEDLRAYYQGLPGSSTPLFHDRGRVPGYRPPDRAADGSDADALEAWPERHLLGTRLGPNPNGRQW